MKWLILLLFLIPFASATSSENFMINSMVISGGGSNVTSSNYQTNLLVGDIAGETNGSTYKTQLGFWFSEAYNPNVDTAWIIAIILSLLGTMAYMGYIAKTSEHIPIQILFFFIALFIGIACLHVANLLGEVNIDSSLNSVMWATILAIVLFIIYIFLNTNIFKLKYK